MAKATAKNITRSELKTKLAKFFEKNPNPSDVKVHRFADSLGVEVYKVGEAIYSMLTARLKK